MLQKYRLKLSHWSNKEYVQIAVPQAVAANRKDSYRNLLGKVTSTGHNQTHGFN